MVNQVVHRQPLLKDVTEVLLWVLQPNEGGINHLSNDQYDSLQEEGHSDCISLVVGYISPSENVVHTVFSILVKQAHLT